MSVEHKKNTRKRTSTMLFRSLAEKGNFFEAQALLNKADMFDYWIENEAYTEGQLRRYNHSLYRCIKEHISKVPPPGNSEYWEVVI